MLINLRNALMAGKRLPYDAEVEYLGNGLTTYRQGSTIFFPYIDVGVAAGSDVGVRITYAYTTALVNHYAMVCGSFVASGSGYFGIYNANTNNYKMWGGATKLNATINVGDVLTTSTNFMSSGIYEDIFNGEQINYSTLSGAPTFNTGDIWLFSVNKGSYRNYEISGLRVYSMQVSVGQTLVRDFIPVRVGTVGYLYDRVSGKLFGNAGTGDFVIGPDVVPVEYIESHGTQWIDTGIVCQNSNVTAFEFKFAYTKYPSTRYVWGSDKGANQGINNLGHYFSGLNDSNVVIPLQTYHTGRSEVHPSSIVKAYIDGTQFRSNTGSNPYTNPFCLFALGGYTIQRIDGLRISSCKVLVDSTLIRDYKAIRVGTDATSWEGAMMDVLTRRIYRNAGTGAFTYGNDLKYPIPAE